jgi:putative oxidoreductase
MSHMNLALFVFHLTIGLIFAGHGAQKLFGAFGGGGLDGTGRTFDNMGLRPGRVHAQAAAAAEFFGGMAIAFGLFLPFAAAAVIAVMAAAVATVHYPNGFWNTNSGYEYNLALAAAAFMLAGAGGGEWTLDYALGLDLTGAGWAIGALLVGVAGGGAAVLTGRRYAERQRPGRPPRAHPA